MPPLVLLKSSATRFRHIALEFSGVGQLIAVSDARANSIRYGHAHYGMTNGNAYRLDRAARLQNLMVYSSIVAASVDSVFTVCAGSSHPPPCNGPLACTLVHGTSSCLNTVDDMVLPAGTYYMVKATGQGGNSGRIAFSLEMAEPASP